jgi:WhiB family redox-sensing transcriptional regulator
VVRPVTTPDGHTITYRFEEWMDRAACLGMVPPAHPDTMFPETGSGKAIKLEHRRALAVCYSCPVRSECFDHAMTNRERNGVWGGTLEGWRTASFAVIRRFPGEETMLREKLRATSYINAKNLGVFAPDEEETA